MKPNAGTAGTALRAGASAALALLMTASAVAGDSATFAPIGYSDDRRYFAYEEFSIGGDASQPFATIGLVDLTTGQHVAGSPWTAGGKEEIADTVTALRLQATDMAAEALSVAAIEDPAHYLALIGDGVRDSGTRLTFARPQGADPDALGPDMLLDVVTLSAMVADSCSADLGGMAIGFRVILTPDGPSRDLYTQDAVCGHRRLRPPRPALRRHAAVQWWRRGYAGCGDLHLHRRL